MAARGSTRARRPQALLQPHATWRRESRPRSRSTVRGPPRVAQPGAVWLAKRTGNPVLPFHIEANHHWTANSWDCTQIPKPFATVALAMGEPLDVSADAGDQGLEEARRELESRLQSLEARALELVTARSVEQS